MRKIDDALLIAAQRAYLWLFDWTGVYVGTLLFLLGGLATVMDVLAYGRLRLVGYLLVGTYGLFGWWRINLQSKGDEAYNAVAETETKNPMRWFFLLFFVFFLVQEIAQMKLADAVQTMAFICALYLFTVKIRPRDPKEFFEREAARARK